MMKIVNSKTLWGTNLSTTFLHEHTHTLSLSLSLSLSPASPFSLLSPSEPILFGVWSMRLENIYFDLFYGSLDALQLWAVMCLIDNERKGNKGREGWRESHRERMSATESCIYLIMMTHWFRSVCHNLSGKGKHLTRSGHSLVPACFN